MASDCQHSHLATGFLDICRKSPENPPRPVPPAGSAEMGSRFSGLTARFEQGDRHAATMEHVVSDWAAGFGAIAYCSVLILPNPFSFSRISHNLAHQIRFTRLSGRSFAIRLRLAEGSIIPFVLIVAERYQPRLKSSTGFLAGWD